MDIVVHPSLSEINAEQWNSMLSDNNPFMRHEFLLGLEQTSCVCQTAGWEPSHIAGYENGALVAAMPCYIKSHSYGEYIFDWSWADAHHRHGLEYYPKLSNAIPFTPASGERWLIAPCVDKAKITKALFDTVKTLMADRDLSSFHSLFLNAEQCGTLDTSEYLIRHSTQFHWQNREYRNFDDFLARMSSKKRKNINRERRRVRESGVTYRWLSGKDLDQQAVNTMYSFYSRTIAYYGAQSYLNKDFYQHLADNVSEQTLFLFAYFEDQVIAGGLYFKSDNALYGRYWGALNNFHSVHFETCYYQAIDWCIKNGYQRFEAGAQGEHKLARGLEPTTTYSAHLIRNPQFHHAIDEFVQNEQDHISQYNNVMQSHSPFKAENLKTNDFKTEI
ncbi:MAG: putative N-acyltransferase [Cryomorphaceae bacterium]|jgi:predicted N-acyltransferase